ncbi:uncharacterized mitochondrial protein AtMg00810-like [Lactuca sativa]|uniref:uncharacterized mitochondrial protein AtMg00810-like n=1 Tax=Lactuca sativa TaxID=4236 RepID=UPI000CD9A87A|nr:uncharacterized mitochondrial protein AtMg00810-like [Lactuca sativa]
MVGDSKVKVPIAFGMKLSPSLNKPVVDMSLYRQMIGSLMFQANPFEPHMTAVKNIFRYLKRTTSLRIWYPSNSGFFAQAFSDADLGGCRLNHKSTMEGCQFLEGKLVSWKSKKQTCVSLSTVEAD